MRFLLFLLTMIVVSSSALADQPSILQCVINASADRSHDSIRQWVGPLPEPGKAPDRSILFEISKGGTESGFIFADLDTETPRIRPVMSWKNKETNAPEVGAEKKARVFRRTDRAIFFSWEFAPDEFYTAVLHLSSRKAAISQISTCRGSLCDVDIKAMTADCR